MAEPKVGRTAVLALIETKQNTDDTADDENQTGEVKLCYYLPEGFVVLDRV